MNQRGKINGFTLVELMLAMGFVSALLLAIAMTVIQIGNIYNRGITMKAVNQAGVIIASDFKENISSSEYFYIDNSNGANPASSYIVNKSGSTTIGGRLCTGRYTYVWNSANAIRLNHAGLIKYSGTDNNSRIYLVRAYDPGMAYCIRDNNGFLPSIEKNKSVELLNSNITRNNLLLAVYDFNIRLSSRDISTNQTMYSIDIIIGTADDRAVTGASDDMQCLTSGDNEDLAYCSLNHIKLVIRSGNIAR